MRQRFTKILFLGLALGLFASQPAWADVYAKIHGTVTDPSGAVISDAQVTATNTNTGISTTTKSQSTGLYEFLQLPVGSYTVTVTKQQFKTFKSTAVTLDVNQVYELNAKLDVGNASETVEVKANAVQVETTDIQQKTVIGAQQIVDLPLNGRNFVQLSQLAPGVMASSDRFGSNYATNGSQSQQNSYLINGTDSNDIALNTPGMIPSPDAIQEFNLITSTINPEYGRNSGGILNAMIKGGTNQWHGGIFDFYRDTFMNARNFFTVGPRQPIFHQNQFGGTFGGPIFKDRTFFFLSYQGTYNAVATPTVTTVLSSAQRAGNFNGFSVSPTLFNPVAVGLMNKYVPLPNAPSNGFAFSPTNTGKTDQGIARVDHNFNNTNQVWAVFADNNNRSTQALPFTGATLPGFSTFSTSDTKEITIAYNHTFNNTMLNEVRLGWHYLNFDTVEPQQVVDPSTFGFTNIHVQNPKAAQLPVIAVTGLFTLGFSDNGPQPRKDTNYQITDNFSKIMGRHSLKFGFDGRRFQVDNPFFFLIDGHFDFGGNGAFSTGDPAADFLLGIPDDYLQGSGAVINARAYEYYGYGQDQWKVRNNLTLTFGAGYQIDTPYDNTQYGGKAFNCFIPGQQSKVFPTAPAGMNYPGDPGCRNSGAETRYNHIGPRFGFAYSPQWGGRVTRGSENKTSVRGGFGIYFNRYEEETALQNLGAPPFGLQSNGVGDAGGSPAFADPWTDISGAGSINNKFPFTPPALGSAVDFTFFEPTSLNTVSSKVSTPYSMNFNLNIQREFAGNTVFSVGYVGALGRHEFRILEADPITLAGARACAANPACGGSTLHRNLQHFFFPSHSAAGTNLAQCPPTGDCFGSWGTQVTDGTSNYSSLQLNVTKGLSHGLQLITSYTWSHSIDNGSGYENSAGSGSANRGLNPFFPNLNVGDSAFDARQRLVIGYLYQIPSLHKVVNWAPEKLFGGWKMTGITTFQRGFPISIGDSSTTRSLTCDNFEFYGCWDNPNQLVSAVHALDPRTSRFGTKNSYWFDPSSFAHVPRCAYVAGVLQNGNVCAQFGNLARNPLHGPGINNFDFSFQKDTSITERTKFQVGLDMFNLFNHTQFNNPNGNVNSGNFGRITGAAAARILQIRAKVNF
jgi:hypothetical protein